jgi:bifunctional DNA-binding transcriptional regulator/antitoxin component of YhaV-PrlF toxin-antitoxin module
MALIRTFVRVDAEGKIELPRNIRLALGLKEQDVLELKVMGPNKAQRLMVSKHMFRTPGFPAGS